MKEKETYSTRLIIITAQIAVIDKFANVQQFIENNFNITKTNEILYQSSQGSKDTQEITYPPRTLYYCIGKNVKAAAKNDPDISKPDGNTWKFIFDGEPLVCAMIKQYLYKNFLDYTVIHQIDRSSKKHTSIVTIQ